MDGVSKHKEKCVGGVGYIKGAWGVGGILFRLF